MMKGNRNQMYLLGETPKYYPIESQTKQKSTPLKQKSSTPNIRQKSRQREVQALQKINQQLKEREEIYIQKLMQLQEGLENQHTEFVKLQDLYTELFESYKSKEIQIAELQLKFRQTERVRDTERMKDNIKNVGISVTAVQQSIAKSKDEGRRDNIYQQQLQQKEREFQIKQKQWIAKQQLYISQIADLNTKLSKQTETQQRIYSELTYFKSKDKLKDSKAHLENKVIEELEEWQKKADQQKQQRIKLQYENEFLKIRNEDLEKNRVELQKILAYKQKEIIKMREEKIATHRQSSQKIASLSPKRQSRVLKKTIDQTPKTGLTPNKATEFAAWQAAQKKQFIPLPNLDQKDQKDSQSQQYFSFSRDKHDSSMQSDLPTFPPELEIDSLIHEHKK